MRISCIALLCPLLSSCIVIPTSFDSPLPREKIEPIKIGVSNKTSIRELLGEPDVTRDNQRIWLYSKGKLFALVLPLYGSSGFDIREYEWLFLRFDQQGNLIEKELNHDKKGCTQSGYCLHDGWVRYKGVANLLHSHTMLLQPSNTPYLSALPPGYCHLYIYGTGTSMWIHNSRTSSIKINDFGPIVIDIETYAHLVVPAGKIKITFFGASVFTIIPGKSEFDCESKQTKYLGLYTTMKDAPFRGKDAGPDPNHLSIFELRPEVAIEEIKNRNLIVNP